MKTNTTEGPTRRDFLKTSGQVAATTLAAAAAQPVHAAEDHTIRLALVGCGGRGSGAAVDALAEENGPLKLVALADVFEHRLTSSYQNLAKMKPEQVDVPEERRFLGFDAYRHAMDALRPGDVVLLATPPAFRWVHFAYALERGLHVFMEKPVTVDGPSTRRFLELAARSEKTNLKIGVGLMCRHCEAREQLKERLDAGAIGDISVLRAFRVTGPVVQEFTKRKPEGMSELLYQVQRFHAFLWASGGLFSDFLIHNIDECCWMKGAWPVEAKGIGGRHYREDYVDQNFDVYSVEYTFDDGAKLIVNGRNMPGCDNEFASYAHGTSGAAVISTAAHTPARCRIYRGQKFNSDALVWRYPARREPNPYRREWVHLIAAIRNDQPYNETRRGAEASLITSMGRFAAHTGRTVTRDEMLASDHEFAPAVDQLALDSPAPLLADKDGKYPVPQPGLITEREY
ncbi:MAG: gfo/Idh/MocA family oxidoreductase [Planctomycetota bacterium]|nr:MAG: gfo/Idh/MocA family oxidoreductase [Planctomycetota bacterium]REK37925.1 MAG: gfo/Idh/MocA family oxidoreductase [Planctomycetota bacterium]